MNTALPTATDAAFDRATSANGGGAIGTQPLSQRFATHRRGALQPTVQLAVSPPLPAPLAARFGSPPVSPAPPTVPEPPPWSKPAGSSSSNR